MTKLKHLARQKGMRYRDIADELDLTVYQVRDAGTTKKAQYDKIMSYLNTLPDTDLSIINKALYELEITAKDLSVKLGLHPKRIGKIRAGYHNLYADIEQNIREML